MAMVLMENAENTKDRQFLRNMGVKGESSENANGRNKITIATSICF